MKFCFGDVHTHDSVVVEAKNIEHAIKIFKVSELFPEKCVDSKFYKKKNGCYCNDYDSDLHRNTYVFKVDDPKIFIYQEIEDHEWKKVGSVGLKECINVDFKDLIPQKNLLAAPKIEGAETETEEHLPIVINAQAVAGISSKIELRNKHDEVARRKAELENMVSEMNQALNVLYDELKQKQKIVYIIETYLGIREEIVQIADGDPAPKDSHLTLYQQKLFMDEEVGIWDDPEGQGIDCQQIEEFDAWIIKHYKTFAYDPLSIVVWQVRRSEKEYGDLWANVQFNHWNKTTYFLIRNGSRLHRIWSNVTIDDRLFPTKNEYMNLIDEEKEWGEKRVKEELQKKHESYLYGLIAIQGIIERTDILGTWLRQQGVNLLSPRGNIDKHIKFIRDAETEFWIGDGRPRWEEFVKANRATVTLGSRICIATRKYYFRLYGKEDNDNWRCAPFHPSKPPYRDYCYVVEAIKGISKDYCFSGRYSADILIRYHPGDTIWDRVTFEEKERKRRVPWLLYRSEVVNFDKISLEEADYYMKSRLDRKNYIHMLPTLYWIRKVKLKEKKLEDEFMKMVAGKLKWELNEANEAKIREVIQWWKLKNKWKRAITIKESTATRMIIKRLKNK